MPFYQPDYKSQYTSSTKFMEVDEIFTLFSTSLMLTLIHLQFYYILFESDFCVSGTHLYFHSGYSFHLQSLFLGFLHKNLSFHSGFINITCKKCIYRNSPISEDIFLMLFHLLHRLSIFSHRMRISALRSKLSCRNHR